MTRAILMFLLFAVTVGAKEVPTVIVWPSDQKPIVRFTFGRFTKVGSLATQNSYVVEVTAENLWDKPIPSAAFDVYVFGKDNVRVGSGYMTLNQIGVRETVRFTLAFGATGAQPASLKILATMLPKELGPVAPLKTITITVYSVPAGATLKVDGEEVGVTPKHVKLAVGKHLFQFNHEGYHEGSFRMEVGPDDVSGGTVSYELGSQSHDTVELRDGSTIIGDVESMNATSVTIRVGGNMQVLERNRVKRILLVEREEAHGQEIAPAK